MATGHPPRRAAHTVAQRGTRTQRAATPAQRAAARPHPHTIPPDAAGLRLRRRLVVRALMAPPSRSRRSVRAVPHDVVRAAVCSRTRRAGTRRIGSGGLRTGAISTHASQVRVVAALRSLPPRLSVAACRGCAWGSGAHGAQATNETKRVPRCRTGWGTSAPVVHDRALVRACGGRAAFGAAANDAALPPFRARGTPQADAPRGDSTSAAAATLRADRPAVRGTRAQRSALSAQRALPLARSSGSSVERRRPKCAVPCANRRVLACHRPRMTPRGGARSVSSSHVRSSGGSVQQARERSARRARRRFAAQHRRTGPPAATAPVPRARRPARAQPAEAEAAHALVQQHAHRARCAARWPPGSARTQPRRTGGERGGYHCAVCVTDDACRHPPRTPHAHHGRLALTRPRAAFVPGSPARDMVVLPTFSPLSLLQRLWLVAGLAATSLPQRSSAQTTALYHGWTSPVQGCATVTYDSTETHWAGGTYPFMQGDSNACKAWKLAATICNAAPYKCAFVGAAPRPLILCRLRSKP
jgi:hypothetical protein